MYLHSKTKVYSGETVSYDPDKDYTIATLPLGIGKVTFNLSGSLSTPGMLKVEDIVNENTFIAYDLDGNVLKYNEDYFVEIIGTPLTITKKKITVSSTSATFKYTGKEQTANSSKDITVTVGPLIEGHRIEAVITGSITDIGITTNYIKSVRIYDASGKDVTEYYDITKEHGTLRVI